MKGKTTETITLSATTTVLDLPWLWRYKINIFIIDDDPIKAAQAQCNKHVVKMLLESAQMLCTVARLRGIDAPYKSTHVGHPCTRWVASSCDNQAWLQEHFWALCEEYTRRYGRVHKTQLKMTSVWSQVSVKGDPSRASAFVQAMPKQWQIPGDPVLAYRCFYIAEKSHFARWAPRASPPGWWPFSED